MVAFGEWKRVMGRENALPWLWRLSRSPLWTPDQGRKILKEKLLTSLLALVARSCTANPKILSHVV